MKLKINEFYFKWNSISKKTLSTLIAIFFFPFCILCASAENIPAVKEQLNRLNKCWLNKNFDDAILKEKILLKDDVSLIRMHLSLVEKKLREKNMDGLSEEQKEKREKCLDILHKYCERGIFPRNIYHKERTPYFIDDMGTACAVGQLIISTGYAVVAKRISKENNYGYIKELNEKYPEIKTWADKFGFTVDELAWIQPTYSICDTACVNAAQIYVVSGIPPYTYLWNTGNTTDHLDNLCPGATYNCEVRDSLGDTVSTWISCTGITGQWGDTITIPNAIVINLTSSSSPDDGSCNGMASVTATGGVGGYDYHWLPGGQTTATAVGLCTGVYVVRVNDQLSFCGKYDTVDVPITSGIIETGNNSFSIYPNPTEGEFTISLSPALSKGEGVVEICNTFGEKNFEEKLNTKHKILNTNLSAGFYFVRVRTDKNIFTQKIIIQ